MRDFIEPTHVVEELPLQYTQVGTAIRLIWGSLPNVRAFSIWAGSSRRRLQPLVRGILGQTYDLTGLGEGETYYLQVVAERHAKNSVSSQVIPVVYAGGYTISAGPDFNTNGVLALPLVGSITGQIPVEIIQPVWTVRSATTFGLLPVDPNLVVFTPNANSLVVTATVPVPGVYTFRLTGFVGQPQEKFDEVRAVTAFISFITILNPAAASLSFNTAFVGRTAEPYITSEHRDYGDGSSPPPEQMLEWRLPLNNYDLFQNTVQVLDDDGSWRTLQVYPLRNGGIFQFWPRDYSAYGRALRIITVYVSLAPGASSPLTYVSETIIVGVRSNIFDCCHPDVAPEESGLPPSLKAYSNAIFTNLVAANLANFATVVYTPPPIRVVIATDDLVGGSSYLRLSTSPTAANLFDFQSIVYTPPPIRATLLAESTQSIEHPVAASTFVTTRVVTQIPGGIVIEI